MHMADALVSPAVGAAMMVVSGGLLKYSVDKIKQDFQDEYVPLMGVMGAFIFAAQMINFTIPGTGSSGHIGGAVLLAALLGPYQAFLVLSSVLIVQALFFADGGLLALGCNIFNMAFFGCFVTYPLIFKPLLQNGFSKVKVTAAALLSCVISLQLGAFCVVLETLCSGVTELPFGTFALLMQPIHLAIGAIEGVLTAMVLVFLHSHNPQLVSIKGTSKSYTVRSAVIWLGIAALFIGSGLSLLASEHPDGLEWAIERTTDGQELSITDGIHSILGNIQDRVSFLPDYNFNDSLLGTSISGVVGILLMLILIGGVGFLFKKRMKSA